jgi:uncharacterized membrane protein YgdD (TMEM256/DUF423 family)
MRILNKENETWVAFGVSAVALSIALAAYGRHAMVDPILQMRWSIAVDYMRQMGFGLLILVLMRSVWLENRGIPWPERFLVLGVLLFSGVLLLESLAPEWVEGNSLRLAPPLGGMFLIISWLWFLIQFIRRKKAVQPRI